MGALHHQARSERSPPTPERHQPSAVHRPSAGLAAALEEPRMTVTESPSAVNPALTPEPLPAPVASTANLTRNSRAERARMPVALHVAEDVAIQHGVCIRPITQRVTDTFTGEV